MITRFTALGKVESLETKDLARSRLVNLNLSLNRSGSDESSRPLKISAWNDKSDQLAYIKEGQAVVVAGWYAHTKGKEGRTWREFRLTHIYHADPNQAPWCLIVVQGWVSEVGSVIKSGEGWQLRWRIMVPDYHQQPQHYECRYQGAEAEVRAVAQEVTTNALAFVEGSPGFTKEMVQGGDEQWNPIINVSYVASTGAVTKVVQPATDTRAYDQAAAAHPSDDEDLGF